MQSFLGQDSEFLLDLGRRNPTCVSEPNDVRQLQISGTPSLKKSRSTIRVSAKTPSLADTSHNIEEAASLSHSPSLIAETSARVRRTAIVPEASGSATAPAPTPAPAPSLEQKSRIRRLSSSASTAPAVVASTPDASRVSVSATTPSTISEAEAEAAATRTTTPSLDQLIEESNPGPFHSSFDDRENLVSVFPEEMQNFLRESQIPWSSVIEVIFDLGRPPYLLYNRNNKRSLERHDMGTTPVTTEFLQHITRRVGEFSSADNRAGISGTLHRISRKLNRSGNVVGLTIRVGRSIDGLHVLLKEELVSGKSILLVGKPGSGKTTLIRDCAKFLAEFKRVEIVDTSNEIAGDGDVPHAAIGQSRRMMVPMRSHQHMVLLETVQNHNPETLVIDEIGSSLEVSAVRDVAQRGVQLIATAHGSTLADITKSPVLVKLLGDIHTVILSGKETELRGSASKSTRERMGQSCFDIVAEIHKPGCCVVVRDCSLAVDSLLKRKPYRVEMRVLHENQVDVQVLSRAATE